jgi:hypothetical protein
VRKDRTVHAVSLDGTQVVRYGVSGKWYLEPPGYGVRGHVKRQPVNISQAVDFASTAVWEGGTWYEHRSGGLTFDRRVRQAIPGKRPTKS